MQRETARRDETAGGFAENILRGQSVGDELFQVLRRLRLHAGGNFLGKKLKQKIGHKVHAKPHSGREALLARFPARWNHLADKKSRRIRILERVLIGKVMQLFRNTLL